MSVNSLLADWEHWKLGRETSVTNAQGNLALVQTNWLNPEETYSKEIILADQPVTVSLTDLERKDYSGNLVARGYRLWDSASEAIQAFHSIETYDFNPDWVIEARFTSFGERKPVAFEYIRDNGGSRDLAVPGEIAATINGVDYTLNAFDDDGVLLLVFGDLTNGADTYAAGRFLFVETKIGTDTVILDFNRAFVPPCGFSIYYNCPMPPQSNKISTAIEAGERKPRFTNQFQPH